MNPLNVKLVEEDGGLHFGDDILRGTIQPLPVIHEGRHRISGDGGVYHFFFNRRHGLEFGFPSDPLVVDAGPDLESPEGELVVLSGASFFLLACRDSHIVHWSLDGSWQRRSGSALGLG